VGGWAGDASHVDNTTIIKQRPMKFTTVLRFSRLFHATNDLAFYCGTDRTVRVISGCRYKPNFRGRGHIKNLYLIILLEITEICVMAMVPIPIFFSTYQYINKYGFLRIRLSCNNTN